MLPDSPAVDIASSDLVVEVFCAGHAVDVAYLIQALGGPVQGVGFACPVQAIAVACPV